MPNTNDVDDVLPIIDGVDDPMIANPYPPEVPGTLELPRAPDEARSRGLRFERIHARRAAVRALRVPFGPTART
jgi:hypothetical protein